MRSLVMTGFLILGLVGHSLPAQSPPPAKKKVTSTTAAGKAAGTTSATVKASGGSASIGKATGITNGTVKAGAGSASASRPWVDKGSKVPSLNAKGNDVAVEEMHVASPNIETLPGTTSKDSTGKKSPR